MSFDGLRIGLVGAVLALGGMLAPGAHAVTPLDDWSDDGEDAILPPEQAFIASVDEVTPEAIAIRWHIEPGHYLYRDAFRFTLDTPNKTRLGAPQFSEASLVEDPHFGPSAVFRSQARVTLPLLGEAPGSAAILRINFQGCVEGRLCYPPTATELPLTFPGEAL